MTRFSVRFRVEARADIRDAIAWYTTRSAAAAAGFRHDLEQAVTRLEQAADAFGLVYRDARRLQLHRYPYALFYRVADDSVEVLACMHSRRHPRRWQRRAREA